MRKIYSFPAAILLCSIYIFSGCASVNYQKPVRSSMQMDPDKSYLYGRFMLIRDMMNQFRLALRFDNSSNGELVSIRLVDDQPVYAIEVKPGTYRLRDITYAPWGAMLDIEVKSVQLPAEPDYIRKTFTVEPGKLYYLGDYTGASRRSGVGLIPVGVGGIFWVSFQGGNVKIEQNFINTTTELKSLLPQLQSSDFQPAWRASPQK